MRKSFYQYMMTQRVSKLLTPIDYFAEAMFEDIAFPKHSEDFQEISRYLEDNVSYLTNLSVFDDAWDMYLANNEE